MTDAEPALKRSLSLALVTLYGLGNILGAGIYVLIGKVAANAGQYAPLSFLVASILAGLTAFSYAELSSRYPLSAGEAVYMQAGFNLKLLVRWRLACSSFLPVLFLPRPLPAVLSAIFSNFCRCRRHR